MVWIDDLMRENADYSYKDPLKRPHQLFLGGDQIYADDVAPLHLHMLIDLSKELIGTARGDRRSARTPAGRQHARRRRRRPADGLRRLQASVTRTTGTPDDFLLPADHAYFPAGRRFLLTIVDAQMTTVDGRSHLFSLGEFAAMYLVGVEQRRAGRR